MRLLPDCAGVLSSFGELEHMRLGKARLLPFDPEAKQPKMSYKVRVLSLHYSRVVIRSLREACTKNKSLLQTWM